MSKYTHSQVHTVSLYMRSKGYDQVADMLREYAAHLSRPEWPSEEDAKKAARVYAKERGVPLDGVLVPMRDALQSVRPPVGVVSDEDVLNDSAKNPERREWLWSMGSRASVSANSTCFFVHVQGIGYAHGATLNEALDAAMRASRHAPTAPTKD